MSISLANNNPRVEYSVAEGVTQTVFSVPFEFFDDADLTVYVDGVQKAEGTDFTVTGGDGSTGSITFVPANPGDPQQVTGAVGGSVVVLVRDIPLERASDFSPGVEINRAALNEQLDMLVGMVADVDDRVSRALQFTDYEVSPTATLPSLESRKGKFLHFNETTGAPEAFLEPPDRVTVSTSAPSGGNDGDLWFRVSS
jgi:hypothetical protein